MNFKTSKERIHYFTHWLKDSVFPLWSTKGVDSQTGGFVEALNFDGSLSGSARRCLVQSRQIYSFYTGARMNVVPQEIADQKILAGANYLLKYFQQSDGSFIFSVDNNSLPNATHKPLYTQAFAIFGLAQAYAISSKAVYKQAALATMNYLNQHRKVNFSGFTELDEKGQVSYASNPHMHLFEAVLAWVAIDEDPTWRQTAQDIFILATSKFICPEQKVLGEFFNSSWEHLRTDGNFIYEPGHQYEWAWLFKLSDELLGTDSFELRHQLFLNAEKYGVQKMRGLAVDEMWSNHTIKSASARFWPQGERVKAAARLSQEVQEPQKTQYQLAADEALEGLFKYLQTPKPGYWYDQLSADNQFSGSTAKASSLYHIINAMEEYALYR